MCHPPWTFQKVIPTNEHPQVQVFLHAAASMRENRYWAKNPREQVAFLEALRDVMTEVCFYIDRNHLLDPRGLAAFAATTGTQNNLRWPGVSAETVLPPELRKRSNCALRWWKARTILEKTRPQGHAVLVSRPRHREESVVSAERGQGSGQLSPQMVMSRRLNLLLDAAAEKRGYDVLFPEIKAELAARGVGMSRARWFYMKDGTGPLVKNKTVLTAICGMFDVDPSYLLDLESDELPESIQARLGFVKALRAARVQAFAARTLGDVSPETLNAITEFLRRDTLTTDDGATRLGPSSIEDGLRRES